jgi:hypothetical protein
MSQILIPSSGSGGGAVDSVTGTNGVTASPTTGAVVVSGVDATTSTVGVASFNPSQFTVTAGAVSLIGGSGAPIETVTGDSGGSLGPTSGNFNFTGGTTGLTFSGSTSTETLVGTLGVANGGTGDTSFTPYSVITGGTTSTGTLQNISGVGTTGQVLTSNGTSALPSWQTISSPSSFTPNSVINLSDDFISASGPVSSGFGSQLGWDGSNIAYNAADQTTTNQGVLRNSSFTTGMGLFANLPSLSEGGIVLGGGILSLNWVIKTAILSNSTNTYTSYIGLVNSSGSNSVPTDGIYFTYSNGLNSGNWVGNCTSASSTTSANSAIAAQTSTFVNLGIIVNAAANTVAFYINGTQIANSPITSNIPITPIGPGFQAIHSAGTIAAASLLVDLFYMTYTLTTPR